MQFPDSRILVFCKAPKPGKVKTRLAKSIGETAAAKIHEHLAWHTLQRVTQSSLAPVELWCAPDCGDSFFQTCQETFFIPLKTQIGEDLGQRMRFAINSTLNQGLSPVVVGTDCPGFQADYLVAALQAVNNGSTVIGPAEDGGYVLLGINKPPPDIFTNMPWGTSVVLERTLQRLAGGAEVLPALWDVDLAQDLRRLRDSASELSLDKEFLAYLNAVEI